MMVGFMFWLNGGSPVLKGSLKRCCHGDIHQWHVRLKAIQPSVILQAYTETMTFNHFPAGDLWRRGRRMQYTLCSIPLWCQQKTNNSQSYCQHPKFQCKENGNVDLKAT